MKLDNQDLLRAISILPINLKEIMMEVDWHNNIFIGGGYLRSIIAHEPINDVDVFVKTAKDAELLAYKLSPNKNNIISTINAYTIKGKIDIQIIHRWTFDRIEDVSNSFDFSICCAAFNYNGSIFDSFCDDRFYKDLAAKRLFYRNPIRNEDAGGSLLRVLKYYQKGYRIPLDSLGLVMARLVSAVNPNKIDINNVEILGKVLTGLLLEVDPNHNLQTLEYLPNYNDSI